MFIIPEILLPEKNIDLTLWSEIACDQFVLDDEYWKNSLNSVANIPSFSHLILYQNTASDEKHVKSVQQNMLTYLKKGIFQKLDGNTIYIEREMSDGGIRDGILLGLDLSVIDSNKKKILLSEKVYSSFVKKRMNYLKKSVLDTSHVLIGIDDPNDIFFDTLRFHTKETLYDFHLKNNAGRIRGKKCTLTNAQLEEALKKIKKKSPIIIADGNHSVLSAYEHWKSLGKPENSPSRYILVELINMHDSAIKIYPIHRICFHFNEEHKKKLIELGFIEKKNNYFVSPQKNGLKLITIYEKLNQLLVDLQKQNSNLKIEFVHEKNELKQSYENGLVCIEMKKINKSSLFKYINQNGSLPIKSFSLGHAIDKRFYLETRIRLEFCNS